MSCGGASRTAATFRESEFVGLNGHGNAAIVGAVSMKIRGMEARLRGGTQIFLVPVTSYTTALQERIIQRGDLGEVDPRLARYRRIAFANEDGQFSFHHLRAGDYYLFALLRWQLPDEGATLLAGAMAHARASVRPGETAHVTLTR